MTFPILFHLALKCAGGEMKNRLGRLFGLGLLMVTQEPLSAKPLLIVSGGYGSCPIAGNPWEMRQSRQAAELAKRLDARLLKTCFSMSPTVVFSKASWEKGQRRRSVEAYLRDVAKLELKDGVFVVGQSYGGWLAVRTVLALPSGVLAQGLVTIEPISPVNCLPRVLLASFLTGAHPGCNEAPSDLKLQFKVVRRAVRVWSHFYQTDFPYLHSSSIADADSTTKMNYPPTYLPFGAHMLTETDERIWKRIAEAFDSP